MERAETLGRLSFEPPAIEDAAEQLAHLTSRYADVPGLSLRDTLRSDRASANELGIAVMGWYQDSCGRSMNAEPEHVAEVQAVLQPTVLELLPVVGPELRDSLTLLYPTLDSVAVRLGRLDAKPIIAILQDPEISKARKERVLQEWTRLATPLRTPDTKDEADEAPVDPEAEFQIQAKKWLEDFTTGSWDGQSIHVDPRLLTSFSEHIEDTEMRYKFVLAHTMYKPEGQEYPPAFEVCTMDDFRLLLWLENKFRGRNPDINLITGRRLKVKTPLQHAFEERAAELEKNKQNF